MWHRQHTPHTYLYSIAIITSTHVIITFEVGYSYSFVNVVIAVVWAYISLIYGIHVTCCTEYSLPRTRCIIQQ